MYSDAQVLSATVATVSESSLGELQIPAGRNYTITSLWCGGVGGNFRIGIDTFPSMQGTYIQNSATPIEIGAAIGHNTNISINGPATLTGYVTQAAATSTICRMNVSYIDNASATN